MYLQVQKRFMSKEVIYTEQHLIYVTTVLEYLNVLQG